jgi:hypothetical protein
MLSPNATYLVALSRGAATVTVTVKLQDAVLTCASNATQRTSVDPAGKLEPLDGEQLIETGAFPPATVDVGYVTATGDEAAITA